MSDAVLEQNDPVCSVGHQQCAVKMCAGYTAGVQAGQRLRLADGVAQKLRLHMVGKREPYGRNALMHLLNFISLNR